MRALCNVAVLLGFCKILDIVKLHIVKTTITIYIAHPYFEAALKTIILTSNRLKSIETNYMDKNPGMFSSKTLIYFRLKKEIHKHLG